MLGFRDTLYHFFSGFFFLCVCFCFLILVYFFSLFWPPDFVHSAHHHMLTWLMTCLQRMLDFKRMLSWWWRSADKQGSWVTEETKQPKISSYAFIWIFAFCITVTTPLCGQSENVALFHLICFSNPPKKERDPKKTSPNIGHYPHLQNTHLLS